MYDMLAEKTIVIGVDGAHFELITPWINEGKLPNIGQAIETGITGDLQSVLPPVTSPNWKAYATGKNPGKLGIFWWENIDWGKQRVFYPDKRKTRHTEFWEIIGKKTSAGVINVPTTYPPKPVEPFIVSGAPDAAESGYTHPAEIESELEEEFEYKTTKQTQIKLQPDKAATEILNLIDLRFKAGKYLLERHDPKFLQITSFYINTLHHFFWNDEVTLNGWKIIDKHVGEYLDENYNIILMSDHGATKIDTVFHINTWLERQGYLSANMGVASTLGDLGITRESLSELVSKIGMRSLVSRYSPSWMIDRIPSQNGSVRRESKTVNIDWEDSVALASGQGPVYIDPQADNQTEVRTELMDKLSGLTTPEGKKIINNAHLATDIYHGEYINEAPDIVLDQMDGIHIAGDVGCSQVFTNPSDDGWSGENKRNGLFIATGADFNTGTVENISILDLAPTLLHLHHCSIPDDYDGTVQKKIFSDASPRSGDKIERCDADSFLNGGPEPSDEADIYDRLQDLGYLE